MILVAVVSLTLLYVVALGSWTPWDVAAGTLVAVLLLRAFRHVPLPHPDLRARQHAVRSALLLMRLVLAGGWEFGVGTRRMVLTLLRGGNTPGLVEVPLGERSKGAAALSGFLATLSPDEFLVDVDWSRHVMIFHVIDTRAADEIRDRHDELYRKYVEPLAL